MGNEKILTTYEKAVNGFGCRTQAIKATEELAELSIELARYALDDTRYSREKVLEEIADVEIMLKQLKIIFDFSPDELIDMKCLKVAKLEMYLQETLDKEG
jgi:hypothetical protein